MNTMVDKRRIILDRIEQATRAAHVEVPRVGELLERSCYNAAVISCTSQGINPTWKSPVLMSEYSACADKIIYNLEQFPGGDFATGLNAGTINPRIAASMTVEELNPSSLARERNEIITRSSIKIQGNLSTKYKCPKCSEKSARIREEQIKCSDEGATGFADCTVCGFTWRIYG